MTKEIKSVSWNPWHGCHKISPGCKHCYVYRMDKKYEKDSSLVTKTAAFNLPIKKNRDKTYKIPPHTEVVLCLTSDFLLEEADPWRDEIWNIIRFRKDLDFMFITKRIDRFAKCIPHDWGGGWDNVAVGCTCENQQMADYRLPIFKSQPIKHKLIMIAPMLEEMDVEKYLGEDIEKVAVGGESGQDVRPCDFKWVEKIREQCVRKNVSFWFHQTGANFIKNGKTYHIPRNKQHSQAKKAGIDYVKKEEQ